MTSFAPAVKAQLKARVALAGPTGSGKTWTALEFATVLAEGNKIALIDTERDSARLYANHFSFDVARFDPPYEVNRLVDMLKEADAAGYGCIVVDSLSHFWEGEGGVLDEVDAAASRSFGGSTFAGWKHGTPLQRHMVDTFLGLDAHVVIAMRSKMEYVLVDYVGKDGKTRTKPEKVGMAPVQRAGLEYEFTIVGDMDLEHRITISKSRCDVLADKVIQPHRAPEAAKQFLEWLDDGTPPPAKATADEVAEITAAFDAIADKADRSAAKAAFFGQFGSPADLLAEQLDGARAFIAGLAITPDVGTGDSGDGDVPGVATPPDKSPVPDGGEGEPAGSIALEPISPDGTVSASGNDRPVVAPDTLPSAAEEAAELAGRACELCGRTKPKKVLAAGGLVRCANTKDCEAEAENQRPM